MSGMGVVADMGASAAEGLRMLYHRRARRREGSTRVSQRNGECGRVPVYFLTRSAVRSRPAPRADRLQRAGLAARPPGPGVRESDVVETVVEVENVLRRTSLTCRQVRVRPRPARSAPQAGASGSRTWCSTCSRARPTGPTRRSTTRPCWSGPRAVHRARTVRGTRARPRQGAHQVPAARGRPTDRPVPGGRRANRPRRGRTHGRPSSSRPTRTPASASTRVPW